jgi:hypothetical protein
MLDPDLHVNHADAQHSNKQIQIMKQTPEKAFPSKKFLENCSKHFDYVYPYPSKAALRGMYAERNERESVEPANKHKYINLRLSIYCPFGRIPGLIKKKPTFWFFFYIFRSFC